MSRKLILIGIDGATWKIIGPLISSGEAQNFHSLISQGSVGVLHSTVPAQSPPAWTSMFTGVNPGKHGIVDFVLYEGRKFVPCMSRYRMTETIWRMVSDAGRKCIIINDPVNFPPEKVNGIMTTGLMTPPGSTNWIYPKERRDEIETVARGYECDIPSNFRTVLSEDREAAVEIIRRLNSKIFRVGAYAASKLEWDVLAVIFTATDRLQHFWWNEQNRIADLYKRIDVMLGEFIKCAKATPADIMVVSDHGFGPCHNFVSINGWLEQAGLAVRSESPLSKVFAGSGLTRGRIRSKMGDWPSAFRVMPAFMQDIVRKFIPESAENLKELDITRSIAFSKTPSGIYVRDDNSVEIVLRKLSEMHDNITGNPIIEKVMKRDEVLHGDYVYRAPDLFLQPAAGYGFSIDKADLERGYTAIHRPEGIFIHYRPNSVSDSRTLSGPVRPWDVAASVLKILGVPVPKYFDGVPIVAQG